MLPLAGIFNQQASGVFPAVVNVTGTGFEADATSHLVAFPATTVAGNLLLMLFTSDGAPETTTPSGFTYIADRAAGSTTCRGWWFAKIATGTEGGTTVDVVTAAAERAAAQIYQISEWGGTIASHIAIEHINRGTAQPFVFVELTPAFGLANTLWIASIHSSMIPAATTPCDNFTDIITTHGLLLAAGGQVHSCRRLLRAASMLPANMTFEAGTFTNAVVATLAIKGP